MPKGDSSKEPCKRHWKVNHAWEKEWKTNAQRVHQPRRKADDLPNALRWQATYMVIQEAMLKNIGHRLVYLAYHAPNWEQQSLRREKEAREMNDGLIRRTTFCA